MPVPNTLALTTPPDGGAITAAPLRNDYVAIQAAMNTLIGYLTGATDGFGLVYDSATQAWKAKARRGDYNVKDYGAKGDNVTNDRAAIQSAVDAASAAGGGLVFLPQGKYKVATAIQMKPKVRLAGAGVNPDDGTLGSALIGTAGQNIIEFPTAGSYAWYHISDVSFSGGLNCLWSQEITTHLYVERCQFSGPSAACVGLRGALEQSEFRNCLFAGGAYGVRMENVNNSSALNYLDKVVFANCTWESQTINAVLIEVTNGNGISFYNPVVHTPAQHGMRFDGTIRALNFYNPYFEGCGQSGKSQRTTGSINAGLAALTVASAAGFTIGDPIVVAGAGAARADLVTTITNIVGNVFTLNNLASISVVAQPVTNASYDEIQLSTGIANNPARVAIFGGRLGNEGTNGHLRYSINAATAADLALYNMEQLVTNVPVYDPDYATTVHGGAVELRRPYDGGQVITLGSGAGHTQVGMLSRQRYQTLSGATPSVANGNVFYVSNGGVTTMTNLTGAVTTQEVYLVFQDGNTTVQNNAGMKLAGAVNFAATADDVLHLLYDAAAGCWRELSRSVN